MGDAGVLPKLSRPGGRTFNSWRSAFPARTETHLIEKRLAGRSSRPPEGSPRPTVPSPASWWASLRSRADHHMSKWHSPLRAREGDRSLGRRAWGSRRAPGLARARAAHQLRAPVASEAGREGQQSRRACGRAGVRGFECDRMSARGTVRLLPLEPSLACSRLTFSLPGWSTIKIKRRKARGGGKQGFKKKVDCKEAASFRPLYPPEPGSVRFLVFIFFFQSPCTSSPNWESKKYRGCGGSVWLRSSSLSFFCLSAFLTLVRRLR